MRSTLAESDPPTVVVRTGSFVDLPPGTIVGESYEVDERLGAGAMGFASAREFDAELAMHRDNVEDQFEGIFGATWQRCRVHFRRNAMAHVGVKQRAMVSAAISTAFAQETGEAAHAEWRAVADRLRERLPRLAKLMDEAEHDVLAELAGRRARASRSLRKLGVLMPIMRVSDPTFEGKDKRSDNRVLVRFRRTPPSLFDRRYWPDASDARR